MHSCVRQLLEEQDTSLVQLPCPEIAFLGMRRWGMTREQYDVPSYRRSCRDLVGPVADTVASLVEDGCELVGLWGIDGSPSCGVTRTCEGYQGGELGGLQSRPIALDVEGEGIFIQELRTAFAERSVVIHFHAVPEEA